MDIRQLPAPPQGRRALAPDLARGLMLALIAVANVMIYLHGRPYGLRQHVVEDGTLDRLVTAVVAVAVDARAYPLFAALFGYGLVRIADRLRARGATPDDVRRHLRRRSCWLLVLGLVHALVGFSGDILGWYGLLGLILASRLRVSDRVLLRTAAVWLVLASVVQGLLHADPTVRTQRSILWSFAIEDPLVAAGWRPIEWLMTPVGLLAVVSPVLVGIWAGRRRILERPERYADLLRRTAAVGISVGLLGGLGTALATAHMWEPPGLVLAGLFWLHILTGVPAGLGYAATIALAAARLTGSRSRVLAALRATGERSLSAYLFQSVVFVALLPAWTFGWGATLGTAGAALLALSTWAVSVVVAAALARRGHRGPAEVVLRRLTRPGPARAGRATIR
ncbi:MAG: DUF418 domain-containing protein [Actinomycetaceae bacterium]